MGRRNRQRIPQQPRPAPAMGPSPYLVDVVVPVYGEWDLLEKTLDAIPEAFKGTNEAYRVMVVDNGSPTVKMPDGTDRTPAQFAEPIRARLRPGTGDGLVRIEENQGYPAALNYGVSRCNAPLILILTSDVVMQPLSITAMIREMDDAQIGVVGPKLLFPLTDSPHGPPGSVQHAGVAFNIQGKPFHIFIGWRSDNPRVNRRREMAAVTGAIFMTRRSLWQEIGGFYEGYGKGTFEDMEFCFNVRRRGAKVLYTPAAVGYHLVGGSILKGSGKQGFNIPVNERLFLSRNHDLLAWDEWRYW